MPKARQKKIESIPSAIARISVTGYKSLREECNLAIKPLTLLAGANSAGKSSALQPLLLLKQTSEAAYGTGTLLLDGQNVRLTSAEQMFTRISSRKSEETFSIEVETGPFSFKNTYTRAEQGLRLVSSHYRIDEQELKVTPVMSRAKIQSIIPEWLEEFRGGLPKQVGLSLNWHIQTEKGFLMPYLWPEGAAAEDTNARMIPAFGPWFRAPIISVIHVPGLRGNPERIYKTTSTGPQFPGTFEVYTASMVHHWQQEDDSRLGELAKLLELMGLTSNIKTDQLDDTRIELLVNRLPRGNGAKTPQMVSIADVGFGVSQTLPVLVALLTASPGQLVYIEQPEIHLHPKAQIALAQALVDAANRGVRVVIETHSDILLLALQTLAAEEKIAPSETQLHWFERSPKDGMTKVSSVQLDELGSFGDWPEDFGHSALELENRYLSAAEAIRANK